MYYNFNPDLPEPLNVIHPFQLPSVHKFISNTFPEEIDKIILYGGSLDLACGINSDLDLYVIADCEDRFAVYESVRELCLPLKKRFDILVSDKEDFICASKEHGTVEEEIRAKGVVIYAREKDYAA